MSTALKYTDNSSIFEFSFHPYCCADPTHVAPWKTEFRQSLLNYYPTSNNVGIILGRKKIHIRHKNTQIPKKKFADQKTFRMTRQLNPRPKAQRSHTLPPHHRGSQKMQIVEIWCDRGPDKLADKNMSLTQLIDTSVLLFPSPRQEIKWESTTFVN